MAWQVKTSDRLMMALAVVTGVVSIGLLAWDARPTLLLVVVLWQRVDIPVLRLEGVARWIAVALSAFAAALLVVSGYAVRRTIDFLGLRPIRAHLRGRPFPSAPFSVDGPFRWVRHPLYACILALLWVRPEMMADGLVLAILWSGWMVVGTVLEERDLVSDFGAVYRRYQQQVPMLIPWRGPADVGVEKS